MFYPMFCMVMLTLIIGLITVTARINSVRKGEVRARYYKLMAGQEVPEFIAKTTRSFNNQFEVPVLFYITALVYMVLGVNDAVGLVLAWAFFGFRMMHALIHLTYNHVLHRLTTFFLGVACVVGMWINLVLTQG